MSDFALRDLADHAPVEGRQLTGLLGEPPVGRLQIEFHAVGKTYEATFLGITAPQGLGDGGRPAATSAGGSGVAPERVASSRRRKSASVSARMRSSLSKRLYAAAVPSVWPERSVTMTHAGTF